MVAVAGGAVAYNPWSAIVIGVIAAISFLIWSKLLIKLHVDDPVETAAGKRKRKFVFLISINLLFIVHIGGGLWGIFAVPIFRRTVGPNADGNYLSNYSWRKLAGKKILTIRKKSNNYSFRDYSIHYVRQLL
jgi:ammonia channel protein AmtB